MRDYLKQMRDRDGLTMQQIADKIGITRQYYQMIEAGERQEKMDITLAARLADALQVTIQDIVEAEQVWHTEHPIERR